VRAVDAHHPPLHSDGSTNHVRQHILTTCEALFYTNVWSFKKVQILDGFMCFPRNCGGFLKFSPDSFFANIFSVQFTRSPMLWSENGQVS
jgi:hypothetical protein